MTSDSVPYNRSILMQRKVCGSCHIAQSGAVRRPRTNTSFYLRSRSSQPSKRRSSFLLRALAGIYGHDHFTRIFDELLVLKAVVVLIYAFRAVLVGNNQFHAIRCSYPANCRQQRNITVGRRNNHQINAKLRQNKRRTLAPVNRPPPSKAIRAYERSTTKKSSPVVSLWTRSCICLYIPVTPSLPINKDVAYRFPPTSSVIPTDDVNLPGLRNFD